MTIRGCCDDCGKLYRLPAEGHTYVCKACGGKVAALEEVPEIEPEEVHELDRHEYPHHRGSVMEHRAAVDARHKKEARRTQIVVGAAFLLVIGGAVGYRMTHPKPAQAAEGIARDLEAGSAEIVKAWNAGDVTALAQVFHPHGRTDFRARLERVVANRGWKDGFEPVRPLSANVVEGTLAAPTKAVALLGCGNEGLQVKFSLQYEPTNERWYAYHVDIPPPPLAPTLARFRQAWAQSSPEALSELFPPDDARKLTDLVERKARDLGWEQGYPQLGEATTTGEDELRHATEPIPGLRVESAFTVPEGELRVRWSYRSDPDAWYLANVTFPKRQ